MKSCSIDLHHPDQRFLKAVIKHFLAELEVQSPFKVNATNKNKVAFFCFKQPWSVIWVPPAVDITYLMFSTASQHHPLILTLMHTRPLPQKRPRHLLEIARLSHSVVAPALAVLQPQAMEDIVARLLAAGPLSPGGHPMHP